MSIEDLLDERLESGEITLDDAAEIQTFADFLRDAPRPPLPYERAEGFYGPLQVEDVRFRAKWGDYMRGEG